MLYDICDDSELTLNLASTHHTPKHYTTCNKQSCKISAHMIHMLAIPFCTFNWTTQEFLKGVPIIII